VGIIKHYQNRKTQYSIRNNSGSAFDYSITQTFILKILLVGSIFLSFSAILASGWALAQRIHGHEPLQTIMFLMPVFIFLIFFILYKFHSKKPKLISYVFVLIYLIPTLFISLRCGVWIPQALLIYMLIIVMAGILIGSKASFVLTLWISIILLAITYLQVNKIIFVDLSWALEDVHVKDTLVFIATFLVIFIISWLYNREIEDSLKWARESEKALKEERDHLEEKVKEKTEEIKKAQLEKTMQLYRFAEFGRVAGGFLHDIINPLTTVSLNLEQIHLEAYKGQGDRRINSKLFIDDAIIGTKRMRNFVQSARRQLQQQEVKTVFPILEEIDKSVQIISYKANEKDIKIILSMVDYVEIYGDPIKFNHLATHLISNAIDSYENYGENSKREVDVSVGKDRKNVIIKIQDWGCGISKEILDKIFDPFFTTKKMDDGTGIGLTICRNIVEKEFGGEIIVESENHGENNGTIFTVSIPIGEDNKNNGSIK